MTAENDADREAFEAAMERAWDENEKLNPAPREFISLDFSAGFIAGAAHARQPGEPVAHVQHECGGCGHRWMAPMHPDQNCPACNPADDTAAHPAPPAPVAVPEGVVLVPATATRDWAYSYANWRQGQRSTPLCEAPGEADIERAAELIKGMLSAAPGLPAAPSPASPEKGTERMREALEKALEIVCTCIAFSRRDTGTERASRTLYDLGSECIKAEAAIRAALATLPAEPEGEGLCDDEGCPHHGTPHTCTNRTADQPAPDPKPAEVRVKGLEWSSDEDHIWPDGIFAKSAIGSYRIKQGHPFGCYTLEGPGIDVAYNHLAKAKEAAQRHLDEVARSLMEPSPAPAAEEFRPTHRHVKRGSEYRVIGEAEAQVSFNTVTPHRGRNARYLHEGDILTVYQGEDGKLWCRAPSEFNDGRFTPLTSGEG